MTSILENQSLLEQLEENAKQVRSYIEEDRLEILTQLQESNVKTLEEGRATLTVRNRVNKFVEEQDTKIFMKLNQVSDEDFDSLFPRKFDKKFALGYMEACAPQLVKKNTHTSLVITPVKEDA